MAALAPATMALSHIRANYICFVPKDDNLEIKNDSNSELKARMDCLVSISTMILLCEYLR